jgi:DNA-binding NarL/FixJ family response regulator
MTSQTKIRVLIADDHPLIRNGLKDALRHDSSLSVEIEAEDGVQALNLIRERRPDVAVLDVQMPGMNGLEVVKHVNEEGINIAIIILTMYDDKKLFNRAMELGVTGYILKDCAVSEIIQGIKSVFNGKYYVSPALSGNVLRDQQMLDPLVERRLGIIHLTPTERRILKYISRNMSSDEIAEAMQISPRTVDTHRHNICRKLKISGPFALVRFALENGAYI